MPDDLHGNVPDQCPVALLLVDVISDLEFDGGGELLAPALAAAERIAGLKTGARRAGIPAVYVNDNFGRWHTDFRQQLDHCLHDGVRGEPVARRLCPEPDDYVVVKPRHSGFYFTPLELLLAHLGARLVVVTGFTTESCVLFTAQDAYVRRLRLWVPSDCVASFAADANARALAHIADVLRADVRPSSDVDVAGLLRSLHDAA